MVLASKNISMHLAKSGQIMSNKDRCSHDFKYDLASLEEELQKLNNRLKRAKLRVAVFERDNHLWLRATLPPKPNREKLKPYQQYVSTGAKSTIAGLRHAEHPSATAFPSHTPMIGTTKRLSFSNAKYI
jgi:hypothetical protein